jgi:hypothetical protein
LIGPSQEPVSTADAQQRRLHSARPFRDPRVSLPSHRGWALTVSAILVVAGFALVPQSWIRWAIGLPDPTLISERDLDSSDLPPFIQLLPSGGGPAPDSPTFDEIRVEVPKPEVVIEDLDEARTEDDPGDWTFDPTQAHGLARSIDQFERGVAPVDSIQLARSMLYREMSPGRWPASVLVDYSDLAMAREKWEQSDEWFRRVWGERWKAEGDSARAWDIYDRAVTEVEREGVHQ